MLADLVLDIVDVDSSIEQWERQVTADIEGKFKVWTRKLIWSMAFVILQHCDLLNYISSPRSVCCEAATDKNREMTKIKFRLGAVCPLSHLCKF